MRAPRLVPAWLATALVLAVAGCGHKAPSTPDGGSFIPSQSELCATTPRPTLNDLWSTTFATCATSTCHGNGAGQMLFRTPQEFLAATVRQGSSEVPGESRIVPGEPGASLLYQKLVGSATPRMPLGGPYLTQDQLALVAGWICGGAQPGALAQTDGGSYSLGEFPVPQVVPGMAPPAGGECDGGDCPCDAGSCEPSFDGGEPPCPGGALSVGGICVPMPCDGGDCGAGDGGSTDGGGIDGGQSDGGSGGDGGVGLPAPVILNLVPTEGYQGTPVQLLGAHFSADCGADDVEFTGPDGGTVSGAAQNPCSTNEIATEVPPGAVSGPVQLTVTGAGTATSPVDFTVWSCGAPTLTSISPTEITAGSEDTPVRLSGKNFNPSSGVDLSLGDGQPLGLSVTYESAGNLTAIVPKEDLARPGALQITVTNPPECVPPEGGTSAPQTLTVTSQMPTLYGVSPEAVLAGSGDTTLTLTGSDFNAGSTVSDNEGAPWTVTSVTPTEIQVAVTADLLTAPRVLNLSVSNPDPAGGSPIPSNSVDFTVLNAPPVLSQLNPASVALGSTQKLDLEGSGFTSATQVLVDGQAQPATLVSENELEIASLEQLITNTAGAHAVQLMSPPPGGGYSQILYLTVTDPTPILASMSLTSAPPCSPQTITLVGSGFTSQTVVLFGGVPVTPTSISGTSLMFQLPCLAGSADEPVDYPVTAQNPGSAASNALPFTLLADADPIITSLSPNPAAPGGLSLKIDGVNFGFPNVQVDIVTPSGLDWTKTPGVAGDVGADANGNLQVNNLTLQASPSAYQVTVTRTTDGAKSLPAALMVSAMNPTPALTSVAPASGTQGSEAVPLTVKGSGFAPGAHVTFNNGAWQFTTVVDSATATAAIPAQLLTGVGPIDVKVVNPPPVDGDGSSNALQFMVNAPNPAPTLLSLSPVPLLVGNLPVISLTGTNFLRSTAATLDGKPCTFQFSSPSSGVVTLDGSAVAQGGTHELVLTNPAPGGGDSNPVTVVVVLPNPLPTLTDIKVDPAAAPDTPTTVTAGTSSAEVTCTGAGFMQDSVVEAAFENGGYSARTTNFESATTVTAMLGPADLAVSGTLHLRVENPAPGGGKSDPQDATLINPIPDLTALDPAIVPDQGTAFTLTVWGTGFVGTSQVRVDLSSVSTSFVGSSKLTASVPGADIPTSGTYSIDVTNPAPGGGPSDNRLTLYVSPPAPVLGSISPCGGVAGQSIVANATGANFIDGMIGYFVDAQGNRLDDGTVDVTGINTATSATLTLTLPGSAPDPGYPDEVWVELSIGGKPSGAYPFGLATQAVNYADDIQSNVFNTDCTNCHIVPSPTQNDPNPGLTWKPQGELDLTGNAAGNGALIGVIAPESLPPGDTNPADGIAYVRGCAPPPGKTYEQANYLLFELTPPPGSTHMSFDQMNGQVYCPPPGTNCPNVTAAQKEQALLDWIAAGANWQ